MLTPLSDDEEEEEEPLYDEWDNFDSCQSPPQNDQCLDQGKYMNQPSLNEVEELLRTRVYEESEILELDLKQIERDGDDSFDDNSTSEEILNEISDNMTMELLNLFGSEEDQINPEDTTSAVLENREDGSERETIVVENPKKRGKKRLLPLWMRVGDSDPKHFKVGPFFDKSTAEEAGITLGGPNFEFWSSCDLCTFTATNKKNLMKHRNEAHPNEQFICKLCGKKVKAYRSLVQHIENVHMKQNITGTYL